MKQSKMLIESSHSCISGRGRHGRVAPTWSQPLIPRVFVDRVCDRTGSTFSNSYILLKVESFQDMCVQCGQCGKCGSQDQSRIFGRTWQRNGSFAGSLERQWARGKEEQGFLKKYYFFEAKSTKVCDLLMFPAHLGKNIFDQGCRKHFPDHKIIWSLKKDWTSLIFSRYMKRKARRCDSYLQI